MADKSFTDIFAPYDVKVTTLHFLHKGYLPFAHLMKDMKFARYRVHVGRMIDHLKTFEILSTKLNSHYVTLVTEVTAIFIMLCDFEKSVMRKIFNVV